MNKLAEIIINELNDICFFLKNADILDEYITEATTLGRLRKLEKDFGIKWEKLRIREGEGKDTKSILEKHPWIDAKAGQYFNTIKEIVPFKGKYTESPQIPNLEVSGVLEKDKARKFVLKLHRQGDVYEYILEIEDPNGKHTEKSTSFGGIAKKLDSYFSGKNLGDWKEIYELLKTKKSDILNKIEKDFKSISEINWKIRVFPEKSSYAIVVFAEDISPEEKNKIVNYLKEQKAILQNKLKESLIAETKNAKFALEDYFEITSNILDKVQDKVGFKIILKPK